MSKADVIELFKFIVAIYPQFEVSQSKIDIWSKLLKDQNPARVMRHAERYAMHNKYPPKLSELRETRIESSTNDFLDRVDEWEREAVGSQS